MATPQLSPGVLVREVDLTVGRADNVLDNINYMLGKKGIYTIKINKLTTKQIIKN